MRTLNLASHLVILILIKLDAIYDTMYGAIIMIVICI